VRGRYTGAEAKRPYDAELEAALKANERLAGALRGLATFTTELCEDIRVTTNSPSLTAARAVLKEWDERQAHGPELCHCVWCSQLKPVGERQACTCHEPFTGDLTCPIHYPVDVGEQQQEIKG